MARRKKAAPPESAQEQAAPPALPAEVLTGLEAIRVHDGRDEELYLSAEGNFFEEAFVTDRIVTAEEQVRFIKKIEALVRGSREYKAYIGYLRNDLGMDRCSILPNLDMTAGVTLEFHHAPLNLFQIVDIIINHRLSRGQPVTSLSVADEVMRMHAENLVGLIPVSRSVHKLIHAGALTIHPSMVHGDWLGFLKAYPDGVTEDIISAMLRFVSVSEQLVVEMAEKVDAASAQPRFREGTYIPSRDEVNLLLMAPAGGGA